MLRESTNFLSAVWSYATLHVVQQALARGHRPVGNIISPTDLGSFSRHLAEPGYDSKERAKAKNTT